MEDNGVGDKKLLVDRSNKRCGKIYGRLQLMSKDKELYGISSKKADGKWDSGEVVDISNSRLYYKVTVSSKEGCNFSSMQ